MSKIGLEWEIDREGNWAPVLIPHGASSSDRGRIPIVIYVVIGVALGIAISGLAVIYRLRWADERLESDLRAVISAEMAALRIGDRDGFMRLQREDDATWLALQEQAFEEYQSLKRSGNIELEHIVELEVHGPRGRAILEEAINGQTYYITWFYWRYDDGWRHIPPDVVWWGDESTLQGEHVTVRYRNLDETFAAQIASDAERWWVEGAERIGCTPTTRLTIEVVPDPIAKATRISGSEPILRVPSPLLDRVPAGGLLGPNFRSEVSHLIAEELVECITGDLAGSWPSDSSWMALQITDWLASQAYPDAGEAPFINSLAAEFGDDFPARLTASLRPESDIGLLAAITGTPLAELPVDWTPFFQHRLEAESYWIEQGNQNAHQALIDASRPPGPIPGDDPRVLETEFFRDTAWAMIEVNRGGQRWLDWAVFRIVDGNWRRAAQDEDFWGSERIESFGSFTIRYRERDEDAVRGMIATLGPRALQIAHDLGISMVPVRIWVWPYSPPNENWVGEGPILAAPETHTYPANRTPGEYLADELTDDMALILLARRAGVEDSRDYGHPLLQALVRWELRRLGTEIPLPEPGRDEARQALENGTYVPLPALWEATDYNAITYWEATALISTIDEMYGEGGVISLLNFWARAESMDDWLIESLGISSAGLGSSWLSRLRALVSD